MQKKQFNSVIVDHDLYEGLCKDGLLVSNSKTKDNKHLYIIGIDKELIYKTYNMFTLMLLSEFQINNVYRNCFDENKLQKRIKQQVSTGNLLLEILDNNEHNDIWYRINNIIRYFKLTEIKRIKLDDVKQIMIIPNIESHYKHIDINLGVKFD